MVRTPLVVQGSAGVQPLWGKAGHYTIASLACAHVAPPGLARLLAANADRISLRLDGAEATAAPNVLEANRDLGFVPLADVPDLVWKNLPSAVKGGRDTAFRSGPEHPNHYADIDEPLDGVTLRERCIQDATNVAVPVWQDYYTRLGHSRPDERGLLPFRVQQFFSELVDAVRAHDIARFVAAAGLVAHYVGDACQPLHGSYLSDGMPDRTGAGVHSAYETTMVDRHVTQLASGAEQAVKAAPSPSPVTSAHGAAVAVVQLMDRSARSVAPLALVQAYAAVAAKPGDATVAVTDALWDRFGTATIGLFADGAVTLAGLWGSAWELAGGETAFPADALSAVEPAALQRLYEDPAFVPSLVLDEIAPVLTA
ncbi:hypothetical protein [Leifsonia virtsii]|uniref:S1/P1 Nuclease n=1 Tax=Leifsonia virtsii TaxID=3035915 RepID=A0ABT8IXE3_9MICO|nr:hypothetical protein [Leifsonia virtsii]MDN4597076.1 hypothetical protein [Leifsonia virtsii]